MCFRLEGTTERKRVAAEKSVYLKWGGGKKKVTYERLGQTAAVPAARSCSTCDGGRPAGLTACRPELTAQVSSTVLWFSFSVFFFLFYPSPIKINATAVYQVCCDLLDFTRLLRLDSFKKNFNHSSGEVELDSVHFRGRDLFYFFFNRNSQSSPKVFIVFWRKKVL